MKKILFLLLCFFSNQVLSIKNFVLISAPGSGKGTFSQYLAEKYGYIQICPGDIFRNEIKAQTELGKKIQSIVDRGDYVDEDIVCKLISDNLKDAIDQKKGFIIDGFPRSDRSFNFLNTYLQDKNLVNSVIFLQLEASDHICTERILGRQVCTHCFKVYNITSAKPKEENKCECGTELSLRKADTEDIVKKRLTYFHNQIEPLLKSAQEIYDVKKIKTEKSLADLKAEYDKLIS